MNAWWITAFACLWLVVMVVAVILLGYLRRVTAILERAEIAVTSGQVNFGAARVGMQVGQFEVLDSTGHRVASDDLLASEAIYVLLHSGCDPCRHLAAKLHGLQLDGVPVIAVIDDTPAGREFDLPEHLRNLFDPDGSIGTAFKSGGTPQAFAIAAGGVVRDMIVPGSVADIEQLARSLRRGR
ncbi:MAG: hypothetical protein M3540_12160 [Actinomycetota bacterium]|nr:hypothetical protein [Actinomycetota bacterium]